MFDPKIIHFVIKKTINRQIDNTHWNLDDLLICVISKQGVYLIENL